MVATTQIEEIALRAISEYTGFTHFLVNDEEETRAYVEDWGLSHEDALEKLVDECE
jgi:3-methyladenine DNA glycosylase AlkC